MNRLKASFQVTIMQNNATDLLASVGACLLMVPKYLVLKRQQEMALYLAHLKVGFIFGQHDSKY